VRVSGFAAAALRSAEFVYIVVLPDGRVTLTALNGEAAGWVRYLPAGWGAVECRMLAAPGKGE